MSLHTPYINSIKIINQIHTLVSVMLLSHLLFGIHNTHSTISQTCSLWVFVTKSTEKRASGLNKFMFAKKVYPRISRGFDCVEHCKGTCLCTSRKKCTLKLLVEGGFKKLLNLLMNKICIWFYVIFNILNVILMGSYNRISNVNTEYTLIYLYSYHYRYY